jgi:hypothetical protein
MDKPNKPNQDEIDEQLKQELKRAKLNGELRMNLGAELQRQGSGICDWTDLTERTLSLPTQPVWDKIATVESTRRMNDYLEQENADIKQRMISGGSVYYTTASVAGTLTPLSTAYVRQIPASERANAQNILDGYYHLSQRQNYRETGTRLFKTLGLETETNGQIALHQFEAAWETHLQTPKSPTSSLIPLREAIDHAVAALLPLRLRQEEARPDKISNILSQVSAAHIQQHDIEQLRDGYKAIHKKLSGAKDKIIERNEENTIMVEGTLYLVELLSAIDGSKLKKKP